MPDGRDLRDRGAHQLDMAALFDPWPDQADRAIAYLAHMGRTFTAADVRELCGDPERPNLMGGRLLAAAKAGTIRQVGVERSSRPERHAGLVIGWQGRGGESDA